MATIPTNQRRMHRLIDELVMPGLFPRSTVDIASDLRHCVMDLSRKPRAMQAPPSSRPMTAALRKQILQLHHMDPDMSQQQIAVVLGISHGRVSETIAGYRK